MNIFSAILETLQAIYQKAEVKETIRPFELDDVVSQTNILIQLNKGNLFVGSDGVPLAEGEFYFIPALTPAHIRFGKAKKYAAADMETFHQTDGQGFFTRPMSALEDMTGKENVFTILEFNTLLHKTIPFFSLLNLPPLVLGTEERLSSALKQLALEEEQGNIGKDTLLKNYSHEIVILLFRYMSSQKKFTAHMDKINYLLDNRLVKVILYIQENLEKDLRNSRLAEVALISADYFSQFFHKLTGRHPQHYVEEQRMKKALELVMNTSQTMKEISLRVGFQDPAYFSRRFKIKYKKNALATRKVDRVPKMAVV